jgi:hypothetical protein
VIPHRHVEHRGVGPQPDRRTVLRGGAALGAAALGSMLLGACGDDPDTRVATAHTPANTLVAAFPQSVPHAAVGVPMRLPYLVADADGATLAHLSGPVTFTVEQDGHRVGAPVQVAPHGDGIPTAYLPFTFQFPAPGTYDVYAEYDGHRLDSGIQVYEASKIGPPIVGEQLPPVDSPTTARTLDVDPLCSATTPCPYHEVDLQDVVGKGKPIVLLVASPAYCDTDVCGPMLDLLVEQAAGRPDLVVLHNEVYKDPKSVSDLNDAELAPVPDAYDLRFQPVLFVTDAAGRLVARGDALVDRSEMAQMLALAR